MAGRGRGRGLPSPLAESTVQNVSVSFPVPADGAMTPELPGIENKENLVIQSKVNDTESAGRGRGAGRGRSAETTPTGVSTHADGMPGGLLEKSSLTPELGSIPAQFSNAMEEPQQKESAYRSDEFSVFNPQIVMPFGTGGGHLCQSIQKPTAKTSNNPKVQPAGTNGVTAGTNGVTAGIGNEADKENMEDWTLSAPVKLEVVNDFQDPGSFPICAKNDYVEFIREIVIPSFNDISDFTIKEKQNIQFGLFTFKLNRWYNTNRDTIPIPEVKDLVTGGHYIVYSEKTGNWCRVALCKWKTSNGDVMLELLDYGGFLKTSVQDMRFIRAIFCDFPVQVQRAKIEIVPGIQLILSPADNEALKVKVENPYNTFLAITVNHEVDTTGKRIYGIILLEFVKGVLKPFNFEGQLVHAYRMGSFNMKKTDKDTDAGQ